MTTLDVVFLGLGIGVVLGAATVLITYVVWRVYLGGARDYVNQTKRDVAMMLQESASFRNETRELQSRAMESLRLEQQRLANYTRSQAGLNLIREAQEEVNERLNQAPVRSTYSPPSDELLNELFGRPEDIAPNTNTGAADHIVRGYDNRGMRLPHPTKAAFSSKALFKQQQNMTTHDYGVQELLHAIYAVVSNFAGCEDVPLHEYKFAVNFASTTTEQRKRFSVKLSQPLEGKLVLLLNVTATMQRVWSAFYNDEPVSVGDNVPNPFRPLGTAAYADRELRQIELD